MAKHYVQRFVGRFVSRSSYVVFSRRELDRLGYFKPGQTHQFVVLVACQSAHRLLRAVVYLALLVGKAIVVGTICVGLVVSEVFVSSNMAIEACVTCKACFCVVVVDLVVVINISVLLFNVVVVVINVVVHVVNICSWSWVSSSASLLWSLLTKNLLSQL